MDGLIELKQDAACLNRLYWIILTLPASLYLAWGILHYGVFGFFQALHAIGLVAYCLGFITLILVHEILHILGALLVGVRFCNISFSVDKSSLAINCACRQDMSIAGYLVFLLAPALVLTPLLGIFSFTLEGELWRVMLVLSTTGCAFDLVVVAGISGISRETRIVPEFESKDGRVYLRAA